MEERANSIENLVEKAEVYTKTSIELFKLKAIDKSADVLSSVVANLTIAIAVLSVVVMVNIGAALWVGKLVESTYCGFFIVAGFYLLVAIVLFIFKKPLLKTPLSNTIINNIRKEKNI